MFNLSRVKILLAPVVRKVDNVIHWINLYPVDNAIFVSQILIRLIEIYLLESTFEHLNQQGQETTLLKCQCIQHESTNKGRYFIFLYLDPIGDMTALPFYLVI